MKNLLLFLCLTLLACEEKKSAPIPAPPPTPCPEPIAIPTSTNPFEKPPPVPVPAHEIFKTPKWEQQGEFKMNDNWSIWTWRDAANHNTCYLYNVMVNGQLIGHGISCVKE